MDAERERTRLCGKKPGNQSVAIGVLARERIGFELTRV